MDIKISTENSLIDVDFVHDFITDSYWAKGRTKAEMQSLIDHSVNFSIFLNQQQIGFARVVTDYGQFAYLMDVFINPLFQNQGYGYRILEFILNYESLKSVKVWRLATADAHKLYEKFGFTALKNPEKSMELIKSN